MFQKPKKFRNIRHGKHLLWFKHGLHPTERYVCFVFSGLLARSTALVCRVLLWPVLVPKVSWVGAKKWHDSSTGDTVLRVEILCMSLRSLRRPYHK